MEAWTSYFVELNNLIRDADRQHGIASVSLAEHFIQRIELAILSSSTLVRYFQSLGTSSEIDSLLEQLSSLLRYLLDQWKQYLTFLDATVYANSYHTPVLRTGVRGRPR